MCQMQRNYCMRHPEELNGNEIYQSEVRACKEACVLCRECSELRVKSLLHSTVLEQLELYCTVLYTELKE